jgi:putative endonuclease
MAALVAGIQSRLQPARSHVYNGHCLVYFEEYALGADAIRRENTIEGWPRGWKVRTIESANPDGKDLTEEMWIG